MHDASRKTSLLELNDVLVRERQAITHLRISQLGEIQQEKTRLLKELQRQEHAVDDEEKSVIRSIQVNNERNRFLLESGLKLVKRLQDNTFRRLALTYAAQGRSLQIGVGPRLLNRSA
jgi:flagellar biosynthesis/type III secretory pathway chaperone